MQHWMAPLLALSLLGSGCRCGADADGPDVDAPDAPAAEAAALSSPRTLRVDGEARVASLALSPDGVSLVATGWGKSVVRFDLASGVGRVVHEIGDGDVFQEGAAAWRGERFVVGTFSATLVFSADGSLLREIADVGYDVALSADGEAVYRLGRDEVVLHGVGDGAIRARAAVSAAGSMVLGPDAVWVARTDDAGAYEVVTLDPGDLAERSRAPGFGSQIDGDERGLAMLNLSRTEVGAAPGALLPLATDGIVDLSGVKLEGGLAAASGFGEGVFLFDTTTGARLDAATTTNAHGLDLRAGTVAVGGEDGVLLFGIE